MDINKQPGIRFDNIILVKEDFWRDYSVPEDSEVTLNVDVSLNIQELNATTELEITVLMKKDTQEVLTLKSTFIGFFSVNESKENMELEKYLQNNSPALMFPFIREHIATITQKAGVGPVLLPPINIMALIKQNKAKQGDG